MNNKNIRQGRYILINENKYDGNSNNIIYRSSWEHRLMILFDKSDNVIKWSSEEIVIPYIDVVENKQRRYFPDFYVELKVGDKIFKMIIEVKPFVETQPPVEPEGKRISSKAKFRHLEAQKTYLINISKWNQAIKFCSERGVKFMIITENNMALFTQNFLLRNN